MFFKILPKLPSTSSVTIHIHQPTTATLSSIYNQTNSSAITNILTPPFASCESKFVLRFKSTVKRQLTEMGACTSCDSRSGFSTAKLILQDGQLQEFSTPIKVSQLLHKNPSNFICNSDDMDFDDVVSAVSPDDFLLPGHLYFVLPLNRINRPLAASEMAALAVMANIALGGSDNDRGSRLTVVENDFNEMKTGREIGGGGHRNGKVIKSHSQTGVGSGRRRRRSAAVLSAIPE